MESLIFPAEMQRSSTQTRNSDMPSKQEYFLKAREFVGTPFRHQGRTPGRGLDCVGLVVCAATALGAMIDDVTNYRRTPDWTRFKGEFEKNGTSLGNRYEDAVPGTVVLLREGRWQTHCAVVGLRGVDSPGAGERTLVHAFVLRGKVVEERFSQEWRERIQGVFLMRGLT